MRNVRRHGMTLIELLVVISILVILIAVAIPVMRPALKDRKVREAARQINTHFAVAKAKAAQTGRPHGVWFVRDPNNANACAQLFIAETPTPFAGEILGPSGGAQLSYDASANGNTPTGYGNIAVFSDSQNLVQVGEYIQFNYQGPKYLITSILQAAPKKVAFQPNTYSGQSWPKLPLANAQVPFQVYRKPMKTNLPPLQLPAGTVIDLAYSGIGFSGFEMNNQVSGNSDFAIMFTPSGAIDSVPGLTFQTPGTLHMLVGRVDQTPALEPAASKSNLADGSTSWISVGHLTGTVTTSENVSNPNGIDVSTPAGVASALTFCRDIAQKKQTMGGR
jgi:prepilin-type N-terminal cleavage/methylation domain-containing protein